MAYDIQTLKADLEGVLHGTTNNQIQNLDGVINRAARTLLLDVDLQETKRILEFTGPIFNDVYDYPIAPDVKGNKIIDIRPQVRRLPRDIWLQSYNQAFDIAKQNIYSAQDLFTINFNTGIKTIRINAPYLNAPVIIDQIDAIQTNGTWSVGGTASNLQVNNTNFVQGAGSLQFDVTTGAAWIENSTLESVNLDQVVNQAYLFTNASVPTGSNLTSINLRFGSSSSDYYTATVTQNQQATVFQNGWNLAQFIWSNMTVVGSPDPSAITYARITLNVTASMAGCLVNGLNSILGSILEYEYYSKYLFRDATTGAFQETVTDDSNLINLDTESYNLLFNLVAFLAIQQQQGMDALAYDGNFFGQEYRRGVDRYTAMYKAENQKPQGTYYAMPNTRYSRYFGPWNQGN